MSNPVDPGIAAMVHNLHSRGLPPAEIAASLRFVAPEVSADMVERLLTVDPVVAAELDRKWRDVLAWYPALANPAAPAPCPPAPIGTSRFSVADFWSDFSERAARGTWRLRAPCDDLNGLVALQGYGDCLAPVLPGGELQWFDPALPAEDEDIVLVKLDALDWQLLYERNRHRREWMQLHGSPNPLATKLLKHYCGERYLVTNESMARLGNNRILGVLRRSEVNGVRLYDRAIVVPNIGLGATTDAGSVVVNSDSYVFPAVFGVQDRAFATFSYTNGTHTPVIIEVSASGTRRLTTPAGLAGTTDCLAWVAVVNATIFQNVPSTQDWMAPQIDDQPANTSRIFTESNAFNVIIPAGHTFQFTPRCRIFPIVGSSGNCVLETFGYTMRIAVLKR